MNQRELDVLNIVCASSEPLTSSDIVNQKNGLTQSTVIAVLRKLASDELVEVVGVTHSGKVLSRTYAPGKNAKTTIENYYRELFTRTKSILSENDLDKLIKEIYKSN